MSRRLEACKYSIAHRDEMIQVLDNWKVWGREKNNKVLEAYVEDLKTNKARPCENKQDLRMDLDIIQRIKSKLDDDEREFNLEYYESLSQYYRAEKNLFKVKATMLEFLKSQMKEATVLDFCKSLTDLPDDCFKSKTTTLDFCKSLDELDIPEERKSWLLQKTVESDITSAYDDARKSFEKFEKVEKFYTMLLQEVSGVEYQEKDKLTDDEYPCTDMGSFKKHLKLKEDEIKEKSERIRQVDETRNPASTGLLSIAIQYVDTCLKLRL